MTGGRARGRRMVELGGTALLLGACAAEPMVREAAPPPSPVASRLAALPAPVRLVGMRAEALDDLLGRPELERQEKRARYRRYDLDGCAVDLYLYESPGNGDPKVAWFEVRPLNPLLALDARACGWLEERLGAPGTVERRAEELRS